MPVSDFLTASRAHALSAAPLDAMIRQAAIVRDGAFDVRQTFSPKVFIPLTQLCRDLCHYCTFSRPRAGNPAYMAPKDVLAVARAGAAAGCTEALFTLGDKPEERFAQARRELDKLGHATTIDYLEAMCRLVLEETGLVPHVNAGVMTAEEMSRLKAVSGSQGLMLETVSD